MQGCPSHAARIAPRRGPLRLARPPARRADSTARRRNRCYKSDATATEWRGQQQGSPALAAWQPCAPRLAALLAFPGSPALASRQPCAAAALPPGSPARQPCAAALRGSPARQQDCLAGSHARHRQPCAAAPGVACFARFGAGRVPRPFTLRTLKTVTARKARLTCADAGLPCTAAPAARRAPAARCARPSRRSPALAARQPCAGAARQPCAAARLLGRQRCAAGPSAALGGFKAALRAAPPAAAHHSL